MIGFQVATIAQHFPDLELSVCVPSQVTRAVSALHLSPESNVEDAVCFIGDAYLNQFNGIAPKVGLLILSKLGAETLDCGGINVLITPTPRLTYAAVLQAFFAPSAPSAGIESTAIVHATASVHPSVYIGHYSIIEANVIIGEGTIIMQHNVISEGSVIGMHVYMGNHNVVGHKGFGYALDSDNVYQAVPHIGNVVIEDFVQLHNHICIDRAVTGSTVVGTHVKIDNHCNIAHGVQIGHNTLMMGGAKIAGSTTIGSNCWLAPGSAITNKVKIGNNVTVGIGAIVQRDAPDNAKLMGNPAINMNRLKPDTIK